MPDNVEQTTIAKPTDSTTAVTQSLASDAYKPNDDGSKPLVADTSKQSDSTVNNLFGSLHFFDSSSDNSQAKAADDQITQISGKDANGNPEVLGVGPVKVETKDPLDILHPIDSAKALFTHPVDTVEQHIQSQVDSVKDLYDRVTGSDKPAEVKNPYDSPEKQHVVELESKITDPAKKAQFEKDMSDFEKRAADSKMDPKEVSETYKQVGRLMDATGSKVDLNEADRQTVAEQIMSHAAHPERIDQGNHNTCAAAALESQVFTKDPAKASQMIADVAISGTFYDKEMNGVPRDTSTIAAKDAHNMDYPPTDNQRTMASQIFQTTAISMVYPDYKQGKPEQNGPQDTGERIGNGEEFHGLTNDQVREMSRRITGTDNGDTLIANVKDKSDDSTGGVYVGSPEQLGNELAKMKAEGKLPAIINVDSRNEPFFGDSVGNVAGGSGGAHDVTIKDYIPGTPPKVVMENQWGKDSEHTLTVDQLYHATLPPGDHQTIESLKKQVGPDIEDSKVDPRLKLELLRQEHMATDPADKLTDDQYQQQVAKVMVSAEKGWKQQAADGTLDEQQRKETWYKFNELALREDGGAAAIGKDMGADLSHESDQDLKNQTVADQQKYSKEFIASLTAQKGHT